MSQFHPWRRLTALIASTCCAALPAQSAQVSVPTSDPSIPDPPAEHALKEPTLPAAGNGAQPDLPPDALVGSGPTVAPGQTPSESVVVNLLNRLVQKGILKEDEVSDLKSQAEQDAAIARANAEAIAEEAREANDGTVRVTYIPEHVKAQIRDQIKAELMAQGKQAIGGPPNIFPEWVSRWTPSGDIRMRYEFVNYPIGNDNTGSFPNFNAINTGAPYDTSGVNFAPQYNTDADRSRGRFRLRFGEEIHLDEFWTAGFRIATGENNSPITTNQTVGLANQGQGGNFSKYAIWLDRAFLKGEIANGRAALEVLFGRFDNPFFSSEALFDEDLGMDGVALKGKFTINEHIRPWLTVGAFPVFNTELNYSSNQPSKFSSQDKALFAAQAGLDLKFNKDWTAKLAAAYYHFENVEGQLSDPFIPLSASDAGNTDNTRPSFAQKGNTYRPLRNIIPSPLNNFGTTNQFQYYGLATPFENLALTGRLDYNGWEPYQVSFMVEYIKNLAFDRNEIEKFAVNNRGASPIDGQLGLFDGSDTAWHVGIKFGKPALEKRWDWNVNFGYRHVGSDAVIDGFNDSEFGGGGTNVEGYYIGGNLAISPAVYIGFRWMSANEIVGPPFKTDIFMFDIGAKF